MGCGVGWDSIQAQGRLVQRNLLDGLVPPAAQVLLALFKRQGMPDELDGVLGEPKVREDLTHGLLHGVELAPGLWVVAVVVLRPGEEFGGTALLEDAHERAGECLTLGAGHLVDL